jgi:ABC-type polysaccharide/polyol phosphate export permease
MALTVEPRRSRSEHRRAPAQRVRPVRDEPVYDSAFPEIGLVHGARRLRQRLPLAVLLARRDLNIRYRRSVLGVFWALLTPTLTVLVMWLVFDSVFPVADLGVPYAVYLASGVLALTAAQQGIQGLGSSFQTYEPLLSKVHLPAEVLAAGAIGAMAIQTGFALLAHLAHQIGLGVAVPATAVLVPVVLVLLLGFSAGLGMLVAGWAIRLPDLLHIVNVALYLIGFLTPTFFPIAALDEPALSVVQANPVTGYLDLVRGCLYEGEVGSAGQWLVAVGLAVTTLVAGIAAYQRSARRAVVHA